EAILHQTRDVKGKRELAQDAAEVKLLAERRLGGLLREMPKNRGAAGNPGGQGAKIVRSRDVTAQTLADLGITRMESSRYQAIESPAEKFLEETMAKARHAGDVATSTSLVKLAGTKKREKRKAEALAAAAAAGPPLDPDACKVVHGDCVVELKKIETGS